MNARDILDAVDACEAVLMLRSGRVAAANASASAKRKKAIAVIPSAADLLDEIGGSDEKI